MRNYDQFVHQYIGKKLAEIKAKHGITELPKRTPEEQERILAEFKAALTVHNASK